VQASTHTFVFGTFVTFLFKTLVPPLPVPGRQYTWPMARCKRGRQATRQAGLEAGRALDAFRTAHMRPEQWYCRAPERRDRALSGWLHPSERAKLAGESTGGSADRRRRARACGSDCAWLFPCTDRRCARMLPTVRPTAPTRAARREMRLRRRRGARLGHVAPQACCFHCHAAPLRPAERAPRPRRCVPRRGPPRGA